METPVKIKGPVSDLQDLVNIARSKGQRLLNVRHVVVKPEVYSYGEEYILVVEADKGSGFPVGNGIKRVV